MDNIKIRKATAADIAGVAAIYDEIHDAEEAGLMHIGWTRDVYPTRGTAEEALRRGDLFVCEADSRICASAIINHHQLDSYAQGHWSVAATGREVMVLHTLTVSPSLGKHGIGRRFVAFYESYAHEHHCRALRIDTQAHNLVARRMYASLGFREAGVLDCTFQGMDGIKLVLLEKPL